MPPDTFMEAVTQEQKRRGRPPGTGDPKLRLKCIITGKTRPSNINYLTKKAERCGVDIDTVVTHYVSKEVLGQIATSPQFDDATKELLLKLNGGRRDRTKNHIKQGGADV